MDYDEYRSSVIRDFCDLIATNGAYGDRHVGEAIDEVIEPPVYTGDLEDVMLGLWSKKELETYKAESPSQPNEWAVLMWVWQEYFFDALLADVQSLLARIDDAYGRLTDLRDYDFSDLEEDELEAFIAWMDDCPL